jgi:hypothetical protein
MIAPVPPEPICVKINDAARMIGVGRTKLYELIATKQLEVVKIGNPAQRSGAGRGAKRSNTVRMSAGCSPGRVRSGAWFSLQKGMFLWAATASIQW